MNLAYPTSATVQVAQAFGNVNVQMYPGSGRHMGIDLAAVVGAPIYAVCPGVVDTANFVGAHGYGRHVIVEHGDFRSLYAHLHRVFVYAGQTVEAGALIGEMGGDPTDSDKIDGASSGPHLHFEILLDKEPKIDFVKTVLGWAVDPFKYLLTRFAPPALALGTVTEADGIRVRLSPGNNNKVDTIIGAMQKHMRFEIAELRDVDPKTQWARVRSLRPEWVCVQYQGRRYVNVEPTPLPVSEPADNTPVNVPVVDERAVRLDELGRMQAYVDARRKELE